MGKNSRSGRLFSKAESALIAAIEIYNKPDFKYREETFAILMLNAWELLLKSRLLSENGNRLRCLHVYEARKRDDGSRTSKQYRKLNRTGNPHTIGLAKCIGLLDSTASSRLPDALKLNLDALVEVRDNAVHYVNPSFALAKQVLEIGTASVRNFVDLSRSWFQHDWSHYNLYLMPIGFLAGPSVASAINLGKPEKNLISYLSGLVSVGQQKTSTSSSCHVSLEVNLSFRRSQSVGSPVIITNSPDAQAVIFTEEEWHLRFPWDYRELTKRCKDRYADFLENMKYHKVRKAMAAMPSMSRTRFLDPGNSRSVRKVFFSTNMLQELDRYYTRE